LGKGKLLLCQRGSNDVTVVEYAEKDHFCKMRCPVKIWIFVAQLILTELIDINLYLIDSVDAEDMIT